MNYKPLIKKDELLPQYTSVIISDWFNKFKFKLTTKEEEINTKQINRNLDFYLFKHIVMKFDLVIFKCMCNFQTKTWEITIGYLNRDEGGVVEETRNVEDDTTKLETEVYRL